MIRPERAKAGLRGCAGLVLDADAPLPPDFTCPDPLAGGGDTGGGGLDLDSIALPLLC
jgi:hypothetical protein